MDQLNSGATGTSAPFAGVRIYDVAERPKSHAWVHGLRHNPFHRRWVGTTDAYEDSYASEAAPAAVPSWSPAASSVPSSCAPSPAEPNTPTTWRAWSCRRVIGVPAFLQHSRGPRTVVDNHGDADPQAGLVAAALDATTNSLGLPVDSAPAGALSPLEDVELVGLPNVAHDTKGVHFGWKGPGGAYRSAAAIAVPTPDGSIAVRAAQLYEDVTANPPGVAADVFVVVHDGSGTDAWVRLGASATVPYPDHDLTNDAGPDPLAMMRTVSIPIDAFTAAAPDLDTDDIRSVALLASARPTGHLLADDLEIWR